MITKVLQSNNLAATLDYVYQSSKDPQVVESTCFDSSRDGAYEDIKRMIDQRPDVSKPVFHAVLSVPEDEQLSPHAWEDIARKYTQRMGYGEVPFVAFKHQDTSHQHIHIIASRITTDAQIIRDSFEAYRSQEVARTLEKKHDLTRVPSSWEIDQRRTRPEDLHRSLRLNEPSQRERMKVAIASSIKKTRDVTAFVDELERQGVHVVPNVTKDGSKVQGISFEREGVKISGSKLDRQYSWNRLKDKLDFDHERDTSILVRPPERPSPHTRQDKARVIHTTELRPHTPQPSPVETRRSPNRSVVAERLSPSVSPASASTQSLVRSDDVSMRERVHMSKVLSRAPYNQGWKAWSEAIQKEGLLPVPKVTQGDVNKVTGMYFERKGVLIPASKVSRQYGFSKLQERLGTPPPHTFARVMVPGQGVQEIERSTTPSASPHHPQKTRTPQLDPPRTSTLPHAERETPRQSEPARVTDTMTPFVERLHAGGYTVRKAPERLDGTWKGTVQDAQGRTFGVLTPREGQDKSVYMVHVIDKVRAIDAHYVQGRLKGDAQLENVQSLKSGDRVVWHHDPSRPTLIRVPERGLQQEESISVEQSQKQAGRFEQPLHTQAQWMEKTRKEGATPKSIQPGGHAIGRLVDTDVQLKEGRFAVIEMMSHDQSKTRVLVPHIPDLDRVEGQRVHIKMNHDHTVSLRTRDRDRGSDR